MARDAAGPPGHGVSGEDASRLRPIAVFATAGSGSGDEQRIVALTDGLDARLLAFDRAHKLRSMAGLLGSIAHSRPPMVVMEGTGLAGGVAVLVARHLLGVPFVLSSGDAVGPYLALKRPAFKPFGALYERALYRSCAGFIAWSPYLAGRALTLGARRAMTAANWAPDELRSGDGGRVRAELGVAANAVIFGLVGSLRWNDRVGYCYGSELVRAICATTREDVHVLIIGDGTGRDRLVTLAGDELGRRVHLVGAVRRASLGDYLAAMDVASLPQSVDGVGVFRYTTKLSEYLAAGLPVVTGHLPLAYDLGGSWLWRLPGLNPWSAAYLEALATLMSSVSRAETLTRRNDVPRDLEIFDGEAQRHRVVGFVSDLMARDQ